MAAGMTDPPANPKGYGSRPCELPEVEVGDIEAPEPPRRKERLQPLPPGGVSPVLAEEVGPSKPTGHVGRREFSEEDVTHPSSAGDPTGPSAAGGSASPPAAEQGGRPHPAGELGYLTAPEGGPDEDDSADPGQGPGPRTPPGFELSATRWADLLIDPGRRSVGALVLVGLVAALVAGVYLWRSRPQVVAAPTASPTHVALASPAPSSPGVVVVDVSGKVRRPGVVRLPSGSRVVDAIKAAGGARRGVDTSRLNLARKLVDGEQILVGAPHRSAAGGASARAGARVDINTATADELEELPDIGPVLAQRIVEYRQDHGGFRSVDELKDVSGIGDKTFADLESKVRV